MWPVIQTLLLIAAVIVVELCNPYLLKLGIDKYIAEGDWKNLFLLGGIAIIANAVAVVCSRLGC